MDDQLRVEGLRCGVLTAPGDAFVAGAEGMLDLQVWAFLVHHPKGTVLFDTGMHPAVRDDPVQHLGRVADLFAITYGDGDDIAARLGAAGTAPDDVDVVVSSHLHFDHAGGNAALREARVVVQRLELDHARNQDGGGYVPTDWDTGQDLEVVDGEHDVFGDGTVVCVPTFGHTPGHQSLWVRTGSDELLLTADACYLRASLEALALPAFGYDLDAQRRVIARLARLEGTGTTLVFGHDPVLSHQARRLVVEST